MAGIGHFFAWDGGCILIGRHTGAVPPHSHQAIQIVFGLDAPVKVCGGEHEQWRDYPVAIIPSRQPHALDATAAEYGAVILIEPETREGRALTELFLGDGIAKVDDGSLHALVPALFKWLEHPSAGAVSRAVWDILRSLTKGVQPSVITDPRIERAVAYINANLSGALTLDDVANQAYLSPGRFRHLFVEQTGMALRPYILWRRFLRVWELLMAGETLSMAAHDAGFADAAHLTRTSRRMFGLAPSTIQIVSPLPARERDTSSILT
jgi:AraC-like DNA-binding protein